MPFGPQAKKGSRFLIGYGEALSKKLSEVKIEIDWKAAPSSMSSHYSNYGVSISNNYFTASAAFSDGGSWSVLQSGNRLFHSRNASNSKTISFSTAATTTTNSTNFGSIAYALGLYASSWAKLSLDKLLLKNQFLKLLQQHQQNLQQVLSRYN